MAGYVIRLKMYQEKLPSPGRGLALMKEKMQKKIKASPRPGNLAGYMIRLALQTFPVGNDCLNVPADTFFNHLRKRIG